MQNLLVREGLIKKLNFEPPVEIFGLAQGWLANFVRDRLFLQVWESRASVAALSAALDGMEMSGWSCLPIQLYSQTLKFVFHVIFYMS